MKHKETYNGYTIRAYSILDGQYDIGRYRIQISKMPEEPLITTIDTNSLNSGLKKAKNFINKRITKKSRTQRFLK